MRRNVLLGLVIGLTVMLSSCGTADRGDLLWADLVLRGAKVVTVDEGFSIAQAVAVREDRIVFVGSDAEVAPFIGERTQVLELAGKLVLPGLIDSHAHMRNLGAKLVLLDISGCTSLDELVQRVAGRVAEVAPGDWIVGGRWDQNLWPAKVFPVHDALSAVSPDNPVFLSRVDGNSAFVNARALELAGISIDSAEPEGGQIIRKRGGEPTGVLINQAMNSVKRLIPEVSTEQYQQMMIAAMSSCAAVGLTGWHEAGIGPRELEIYKKLVDDGNMLIRSYAMIGEQERPAIDGDLNEYFGRYRLANYGGKHMLEVRCIKLFFDGALGSRGAALYEPYSDDADNTGVLRISPEYIYRVAKAALELEMQVATHCIGTRGNGEALASYARAISENPGKDHRFRIEHSQIVREEDVAMFVEHGIVPAMQPTHCTSDMGFVEARVGPDRAQGAYAWRQFLDAGSYIPCGSDFPVESHNPMLGIYAAITRQDSRGEPEGGWFPEQRMTREEAIRGFTIWAAKAAFQEDLLGSIEPGKLADFTILDRDILTVKPQEILTTEVTHTIVGGNIIYSKLK